jgi:hypothetical protein
VIGSCYIDSDFIMYFLNLKLVTRVGIEPGILSDSYIDYYAWYTNVQGFISCVNTDLVQYVNLHRNI